MKLLNVPVLFKADIVQDFEGQKQTELISTVLLAVSGVCLDLSLCACLARRLMLSCYSFWHSYSASPCRIFTSLSGLALGVQY